MKIAVVGSSGKMGKALQEQIHQNSFYIWAGGIQSSDPLECFFNVFKQADVVIDFSLPSSLPFLLTAACKLQKPIVMGTTGYTKEQFQKIELASKHIPIFYSANFSLGIFLLNQMLKTLSDELAFFEQIDLLEWHQKDKKDAPSATGLTLIETIQKQTNKPLSIQSIRSGKVFREHSIYFTADSERLILQHEAYDLSVYAKGALRASLFLQDQASGWYTMQHLLNNLCKQ